MSHNILPSPYFKKSFKTILKKHRSLEKDMNVLVEDLKENPRQGIWIGENIYKVRLAISSKRRGKSDGARIITYIIDENETVHLLDIYDKSEKENISDARIKTIIEEIEN